MSRYATVDIGSNSVLLYIAEKIGRREFSRISDDVIITKLAEGLTETGFLSEMAMLRTIDALKIFKEKIDQNRVVDVAAVGTMALRVARNRDDFIKSVKENVGLEIEVISGEEEASLSYIGAVSGCGIDDKNVIVVDAGGGSTEFVYGHGLDIKKRYSLDFGILSLKERFLNTEFVKDEHLNKLISYLRLRLSEVDLPTNVDVLVGVGGSATTMAAVKHKLLVYDHNVVHRSTLTLSDIKEQIELYCSKSVEERRSIPGLEPGREDTIIAGAVIFYVSVLHFGKEKLIISDTALRHALMIERFG